MSWPIFAIVQLALTTVGVTVVFWLRNRELKARLDAQEAAAAAATTLLDQASERFEAVSSKVLDNWLTERTKALDENDPVELVQKLVLQNEQEAIPDFAESLRRRFAGDPDGDADGDASEQMQARWRELRAQAHVSASALIARFPRAHAVIAQLYDAFSALDDEYGVELSALPEPPEPDAEDQTDPAEEIEQLRASNELLIQQLEELRSAPAGSGSAGAQALEQEADLKSLLQQFTRDSRDMMACIQELEQENQQLREQLGASSAADEDEAEESVQRANHAA